MPTKALLLFLVVVLNFTIGLGQKDNSDSLRSIWKNEQVADSLRFKAIKKYYINHTFAEPDSVILLTNLHYDLAKENNSKEEMSNALNERSYAYYLKGDVKRSMQFLERSIALIKQVNDPTGLASVYANLGNLYAEEGKYQEALKYFNHTLKIFQKEGVKSGEARMLHSLGIIYYSVECNELAVEHFTKSININEDIKLSRITGSAVMDLGSVYYRLGEYEKSLEQGQKALGILLGNNNQFGAADCYYLLAQSYHKLGQKNKAFEFLEKSMGIDRTINNKSRIIERFIFNAELIFETNVEVATSLAEDILKLVKVDTQNELKVNLYNLLYKCYKSQGNSELSLAMHENFVIYNDSLQKEKDNLAIVENAIQKEYEEKFLEEQVANDKRQSKLENKYSKKTYAIILISLFSISILLLYTRRITLRNRREKVDLLAEVEVLKHNANSSINSGPAVFALNREQIETSINRKVNETDWKVLNILLNDPVTSNKEIAEQAFMSVDGIGSSLRRMYDYFEVKESKYKKVSLLMEAIKKSNNSV